MVLQPPDLEGLGLRGALEALFGAGTADDLVPLPEPDASALGTMLVPEPLQALVDLLDLADHGLSATSGKQVPQLRALGAQALDLGMDVRNRPHAGENEGPPPAIP